MLITEFVDVKISGRNIKHYQSLGYNVKVNQIINIPIKYLSKGSHIIVEVLCDYCEEQHVFKSYKEYLNQRENGKDCCKKCSKEKVREGCLEKYGVESVMCVAEFKNNLKQAVLNKYGVENISQSKENKIKIKQFWDNISDDKSKKIREKTKKTCLIKYGVEYPMQVPEIKEKANQTLLNNGDIPTSVQQIKIRDILKTLFDNSVFLNYPFKYYTLDIALLLNDININIEYDGWYWHQGRKKIDNARNNYLINHEWKVLRIKSGHKLPTIEQLKQSLDILINTDEKYQEIVLDDWKEKEIAV